MRELTVRVRFTRHSLGNVKDRHDGIRWRFMRTPAGAIMFLPSWHQMNMRLAAQLLGRHQGSVDKIHWDMTVDAVLRAEPWFKRHYNNLGGVRRCTWHEALFPGQVVGLNCLVPNPIPDDDFLQLMDIAGRYKGLSPWKPGEYGHYEVDTIIPRRGPEKSEPQDVRSEDMNRNTDKVA